MNNNSIEDLTTRLHDLRMQHSHAEDALEEISQESARIEYWLRISQSVKRRNRKGNGAVIRPQKHTNTFKIGDLV